MQMHSVAEFADFKVNNIWSVSLVPEGNFTHNELPTDCLVELEEHISFLKLSNFSSAVGWWYAQRETISAIWTKQFSKYI